MVVQVFWENADDADYSLIDLMLCVLFLSYIGLAHSLIQHNNCSCLTFIFINLVIFHIHKLKLSVLTCNAN